mmetsp:Transcript_17009/g.28830  ORF Transcript_17009/g.28830 Transcript_17009/m.28830 type:complete len:93 (+) Transcript_17009:10-288(+)
MHPMVHFAGFVTKERKNGQEISPVFKSSIETVPAVDLQDIHIGLVLFSMQQIKWPKGEISRKHGENVLFVTKDTTMSSNLTWPMLSFRWLIR